MEPIDFDNYSEEEPKKKTVKAKPKRRFLSASGLALLVIINLIVGFGGGAIGFVFLANNTSPFVEKARDYLGVTNNSGVAVPIKQNIRIEESSAVIDAAKKVSPAVVSISTSQKVQDYFGHVSDQTTGGGTGFIITSDGLIVTNKHVVEGSTGYKVVLNDGRIFDATVQATDAYNDLAVIKIDAKDLPTVELGSSDDLQVGQYVIAVGNALGQFKNSVTLGVVSATHRNLEASGTVSGTEKLSDLIQTDAAINPGNSGGPLVNINGQVVGINTAIASTGGGSIGLGFALPINSVRAAIDSVRKTGEIIRPYLGVRYIPVTKTLQQLNKLTVDYGALVTRGATADELAVLPGSPADKAGIQENDIILDVNGDRIDQNSSLTDRLSKYHVGDEISLKILRKGEQITVKVTLEKLQ